MTSTVSMTYISRSYRLSLSESTTLAAYSRNSSIVVEMSLGSSNVVIPTSGKSGISLIKTTKDES